MKIAKKIKNAAKTQELEATASARIAEVIDAKYVEKGMDTSTIKSVIRLTGLRSGDTYESFIKALANRRTDTGSNGSFSIKLPVDAYAEHEKELAQAVKDIHGHTDYIISEAYEKLPETEKKKGEQIARQNYLRNKMQSLMGDLPCAAELIESYLTSKGEIYIPNTVQLELTLVGGNQSFEEGDANLGWRKAAYTFGDGHMANCYRRNYEIFGRKRVPLVDQEQIQWAMDQVFELAQSFEDAFKGVSDLDVDTIVKTYCSWASSLTHKDHKAERVTLSEEVIKELDAKAAMYAQDLMKIN